MHSWHWGVSAILPVLYIKREKKNSKSLSIKEIRAKMSCFLKNIKVFLFFFFFFKLLKFIIVSFHLVLILFVLKIVLVYFCSYIFIWFEYTVIQYVSLWSSYRQSDVVDTGRILFSRNQKCCYPEVFADWFSVWRVKLLPKKEEKSENVFYVIHLTVIDFCCSRREMCLR